MNTDRKEILRTLAAVNPRRPLSAVAIAELCCIGRADAASNLAGLEAVGLAAMAVRGRGWTITAAGRGHVETMVAA